MTTTEKIASIADWAECDEMVGQIRRIENQRRRYEAARDEAVRKAAARYQADLDELAEERKPFARAIGTFCRKHRKDLGERKSKQLDNGEIGWELGKHRVDLLTKAKDWAKAFVKLVADGPKRYVRVIREMAKNVMIEDYKAGNLTDEELAAWDLRITQTERFFIRPKVDESRDREADES